MEFLFEALEDCVFKVGLKKGERIYKYSEDTSQKYAQRIFDPDKLHEEGFADLNFQYVNGGVDLTPIKQTENERDREILKRLFGTLNHETVKRLAHKGVFPILSDKGYIYLTDKEGKLIGTATIDEMGEKLLSEKLKPNNRLTKLEKTELTKFGLLLPGNAGKKPKAIKHIDSIDCQCDDCLDRLADARDKLSQY